MSGQNITLNATHDPERMSWVTSANKDHTDFPLQNLPHGVFRRGADSPRGGVAIGDQVLDLRVAHHAGVFTGDLSWIAEAAAEPSLNRYMGMGNAASAALRASISDLLHVGNLEQGRLAELTSLLIPIDEAIMERPFRVGGFTDFCTSVSHIAEDRANRPGEYLHPAFKHLPVAYNGRANSVVVDRTSIVRPVGQVGSPKRGEVDVRPTRSLDFELEFAAVVGAGNPFSESIGIDDAPNAIWGFVILNDWSARDFQRWESMFGPFLGKSFATTISPWVVTSEALLPFRGPPNPREDKDPIPLPYLTSARHRREGGLSITLSAHLSTSRMREENGGVVALTETGLRNLFWSFEQMATHHTLNGCQLDSGDLLSSGTVSGPGNHEAACLWEITGGRTPLLLPNGEFRMWLEDGDEVILRGRAQSAGFRSIGFGTCSGRIASPNRVAKLAEE